MAGSDQNDAGNFGWSDFKRQTPNSNCAVGEALTARSPPFGEKVQSDVPRHNGSFELSSAHFENHFTQLHVGDRFRVLILRGSSITKLLMVVFWCVNIWRTEVQRLCWKVCKHCILSKILPVSKEYTIPLHARCPNCRVNIVNPKRYPYLLCRGVTVPLAIRHTFTPEPTEHDKELIAEAHRKIVAAKKLEKAWPGAIITAREDESLHFEAKFDPPSAPTDTPLFDIRQALFAAGWALVDPTVEPDCVSGKVVELEPVATLQVNKQ